MYGENEIPVNPEGSYNDSQSQSSQESILNHAPIASSTPSTDIPTPSLLDSPTSHCSPIVSSFGQQWLRFARFSHLHTRKYLRYIPASRFKSCTESSTLSFVVWGVGNLLPLSLLRVSSGYRHTLTIFSVAVVYSLHSHMSFYICQLSI